MKPDCPRLARQVATLRGMYRHLTKRDVREIKRWHYCAECPGARPPTPHLPRYLEPRP